MGASEMTHVSYFFVFLAVLSGIITVVMYFVLDIKRCWRIVWGRRSVAVREKVPCAAVFNAAFDAERQKGNETGGKTEKLVSDKTEAFPALEETVLLDTMTLVQDIVIMDVGKYQ